MDGTFINEKLECGARLIAEKLPNFHSVTAGIWVGAGSVTETPEENGISHLIEHMLFKGTEKRTSKPVSNTHLDVYKRQALRTASPLSGRSAFP